MLLYLNGKFFFLFYDGILLLADVTGQSFVLKLVVPV